MWSDNETSRDFLNFSGVADTVAEIVVQADNRPVSIGISGAWGVGKSSMIELTVQALEGRAAEMAKASAAARPPSTPPSFVFVRFNAWLYQGYDDARAALVDVIASALEKRAKEVGTTSASLLSLVKRVRWLRAIKMLGPSGVAMALGLGPVGPVAAAVGQLGKLATGKGDVDAVEALGKSAGEAGTAVSALIAPENTSSPPKEIQALRDDFEKTLKELGITLVVLIDDLDRCLPETTVSTLEAIRLFLFLKRTAFVIAADDDMIKHAVRHHFGTDAEERLIASYFDKLIQVPIRVPPLGTQEVRAYLMLLFVENSTLSPHEKEEVRGGVLDRLRNAWKGERVDAALVISLCPDDLPESLRGRLMMAERLTPLMTHATGIAGNPRLIKRFLNALSIRMGMARTQQVDVDEAELAKLLLFERLGARAAYDQLVATVTNDPEGRPGELLRALESDSDEAESDQVRERPAHWQDSFAIEWLRLAPPLADSDLRGALYVSREYAPVLTPTDGLSAQGAETLKSMLAHPGNGDSLRDDLSRLSAKDRGDMMTELLRRASSVVAWGNPPVLTDLLAVAGSDKTQGEVLARFLAQRPAGQIQAGIVRRIDGLAWRAIPYAAWRSGATSAPVKKAIERVEADGDIPV